MDILAIPFQGVTVMNQVRNWKVKCCDLNYEAKTILLVIKFNFNLKRTDFHSIL